ncbi:MAG: hypothetical protein JWR44_1638 [Hymenobacter sp.]|nr:hypothetical protein [Hymenobacter sp.]
MTRAVKSHWMGMGGVFAAAVAFVAMLFGNVLRHPSAYFFSGSGDGLKNYFVAAYFMKYDSGQHFTGMNYPLGEHYTYPDLQPLVSGLATLARPLGLITSGNAIALLNLLVLASMVVAPVVLYAILRRTHLPVLFAAVAALLIGFMAPQNNRLDGHMTLSYGCFIPILWYFLVRLQATPRRTRWYVAYAAGSFIMGLVSAYYLAMAALFLLAHVLVMAWQEAPRREAPRPMPLWRWLGSLVLTALVPLVIFRGWLWLVDPVTDRTPNPFGFNIYVASFNSVFVPIMDPFKALWKQYLDTGEPHGEGLSYIGMVADLALLLTFVLVLRYVWRRRWRLIFRPALPVHLRVGLWAAFLLLLLGMGYPFAAPGMAWLADVLSPVKQFRSLGRFAWPFYYVAGVYAAYYFYRLARYLRQRWKYGTAWSGALLLPLLVLWAVEANVHSHEKADRIGLQENTADFLDEANNYTNFLTWANRKPADFQAILPLPFFAVGTDKIDIQGNANSVFQAYKAALNTSLPIMAMTLGRSSVGQTLALVQLLSSPMVAKPLLAKLPNTKPLLLLVIPGALNAAEQRLVALGHRIGSRPEADLYELPIAALAANDLAQEKAQAMALLPKLRPQPGGLFVSGPKAVLLQSFDKGNDPRGRLAPGAFHEPLDKFSTLYDGPPPTPGDTGRYEVSIWVNAQTAYGLGNMQVKQFVGEDMRDQQVVGASSSTEITGDWVRVVVPIRIKPGINRLIVLYESHDLLVDDLLFRPIDTDVYYHVGPSGKPKLVKNTYLLEP